MQEQSLARNLMQLAFTGKVEVGQAFKYVDRGGCFKGPGGAMAPPFFSFPTPILKEYECRSGSLRADAVVSSLLCGTYM